MMWGTLYLDTKMLLAVIDKMDEGRVREIITSEDAVEAMKLVREMLS